MANPVFITDADVYNRIGGRAALTQLIDPEGTGAWSPDVLLTAQQDACNEIIAAAGVQAELGGFTIDDFRVKFPHLITLAAHRCIYLCWLYGSAGQACPDRIIALKDDTGRELDQLAERRRKHGAVDFSPTPAQRVTQVDNDPHHRRMTLRSWQRGFI
jgi:hypothetical protein